MNLRTFAFSRFTKPLYQLSLFIAICLSTQSAHAFNLDINDLNSNTKNQHRFYDNSLKKISSLVVFDEADLSDVVEVIKNKYLTFYSSKHEKLRATYSSGMYFVKYTHNW